MIIDDEPITLSIISRALKGLAKLKVLNHPLKATELLLSEPPELLLLDVNMPHKTGYQLLKELRTHEALRELPVIFLTARTNERDEEQGLRLGAVDYVTKPINPSTLRMRVETQLSLQLALKQESRARQRADELLRVILPPRVADELQETGRVAPRRHPQAVVMFCDVVGFTQFCSEHSSEEVVARLDALFKAYEQVALNYGVEKIKTIGDCMMAVVGLEGEAPHERSPLMRATLATLEMCARTSEVVPEWRARAGLYQGPLVSGLVGEVRYQFDIWGDTVNVASRLCGVSAPGTVAMTAEHWEALQSELTSLRELPVSCVATSLGERSLKGLGLIEVMEVAP